MQIFCYINDVEIVLLCFKMYFFFLKIPDHRRLDVLYKEICRMCMKINRGLKSILIDFTFIASDLTFSGKEIEKTLTKSQGCNIIERNKITRSEKSR